jgi:hypothetical protein
MEGVQVIMSQMNRDILRRKKGVQFIMSQMNKDIFRRKRGVQFIMSQMNKDILGRTKESRPESQSRLYNRRPSK